MSDWVGIKKAINSDLSTPLNHLIWLNDYKTFGEESYVFQHKDILHELYRDYKLCMNESTINTEAFEYVLSLDTEVGMAFASIYGIEAIDTLKSLSTMNAVANSATAMNAVANSATAMNAVLNSATAMNAVANSATAMNAVLNSATAMNAVAKGTSNWTTAVKKTFFTAINNSPERIKSVYSILKNTTYFTRKDSSQQDGVSSLNSYGTVSYAANGLIACFLGSYGGNNSATTNLFIDGEQVASKASSSSPTMVSESNVNAIACPTATFTETGDGKAAIEVYIAI